MKKKTVKEVKINKFLVFVCKSQDFAQILKNFARSHDCMTVTFRNSASGSSVKASPKLLHTADWAELLYCCC